MFQQFSQYEIKIPMNPCFQKPYSLVSTQSEAHFINPNTPPITPPPNKSETSDDTTEPKPTNVTADKSESDIEVVCVVKKTTNLNPSRRETYFDDDEVKDPSEILRRWKVKASADPNINHSRMNYRQRVYNDSRPRQERQFLPGIYCEKSSECDGNDEKKLDMDRFSTQTCIQSSKKNKQEPR